MRYVPRHAHYELSEVIARYFIFIRLVEEVFACNLWGDEAFRVLHTDVFYCTNGERYNSSDQLSTVLKKYLGEHLGAPLGVLQYRHLATALGRHLLAVEIDADDDVTTTGMDAAAGRTTAVSEMVYALTNDMIGTLNDRHMAMSRASAHLWQSGLFKLKMRGSVATAGQIESEVVDLNSDGSLNVPATQSVDQASLLRSMESLFTKFEKSLLQKLAPGTTPPPPKEDPQTLVPTDPFIASTSAPAFQGVSNVDYGYGGLVCIDFQLMASF